MGLIECFDKKFFNDEYTITKFTNSIIKPFDVNTCRFYTIYELNLVTNTINKDVITINTESIIVDINKMIDWSVRNFEINVKYEIYSQKNIDNGQQNLSEFIHQRILIKCQRPIIDEIIDDNYTFVKSKNPILIHLREYQNLFVKKIISKFNHIQFNNQNYIEIKNSELLDDICDFIVVFDDKNESYKTVTIHLKYLKPIYKKNYVINSQSNNNIIPIQKLYQNFKFIQNDYPNSISVNSKSGIIMIKKNNEMTKNTLEIEYYDKQYQIGRQDINLWMN